MHARRIAMLTVGDTPYIDVVGPLEAFFDANEWRKRQGFSPPYEVLLLKTQRSSPRPSAAWTELYFEDVRDIDTLLVANGGAPAEARRDERLRSWIREAASGARRVCSVCTGAFVLAETGLLDGKRVTTHWRRCRALEEEFPRVKVEADPIFVKDGRYYSSAGSSAAIDLALALIAEDLGHEAALAAARELVVFVQRPGGQSQFSAQLQAQSPSRQPLRELQVWMIDHPAEDLSVEALARRIAMSPRNFARVWKSEIGISPARYVEQLRVESARRLLEESRHGVEDVARRAGFGSAETMRKAFLRALGTPPSDYRGRFGETPRPHAVGERSR